MGIITISREFGSGGETIARMVSEKTGFLLVNKETIAEGLAGFGIENPALRIEKIITDEEAEESARLYIEAMHDFIYDLAIRNSLVILGRGGSILFRDYPPALHVKVIAQFTNRVKRVMKLYNINAETAVKLIKEQDSDKRLYYRQIFDVNWTNLRSYDLVLNTESMGLEDTADIIIAAYHLHAEPREVRDGPNGIEFEERMFSAPEEEEEKFMHPSEEEFAHMLDFYRIRWDYEPKTFLLEWDSEGNVLEAFSPDFYLPDQDLYIELTTQKPKQAWKKNRKIRRMKELYPDISVRLIDKKGFESLLKKHKPDNEDM
ncbi:MAG: cytidylate kinase family protein [Bacillota bacterium]|nr:cytidylate kinase family protein [Bacillota bacterium]MDW7729610.1 cytidylate kinase family protein [Bacillota bacterium]